jgi:uncharacterized membrane protein (UPF0127 family)
MKHRLFVVENETRGTTLIERMQRADSFFTRLRGLTFRKSLEVGEGLWLVGHREDRADAAIHMFFVFFPIGVLWLDRANRVVDKAVARPFRPLYVPRAPAIGVLECQPDVLEGVQVGDTLRIVPRENADEA